MKKISARLVVVAGLFVFAFIWVSAMGLVTLILGGSRANAGIAPIDDGSVKAKLNTVDRGKDFDISLSMKVTDKADKVLEGLAEKDFEVYEGTELVQIRNFAPAGQGALRVCLLIDCSPSMRANTKIEQAKPAARTLIRMLRDKQDHLGLYFFNDGLIENNRAEILAVEPLTLLRREDAWRAIEYVHGQLGEGSPITAAMEKGLDSLAKVSGRRVMIVLTDGTQSDDERDVVEKKKEGVIAKAQEHKVPLYMVNLPANDADEKMMRDLAEKSGGKYIGVPDPTKLKEIFEEIGKSLQDEYTMNYTSPEPVEDGRKRNVTVNVRSGQVGTQAEGSYTVPGVIATGSGGSQRRGLGIGTMAIVFLTLTALLGALLAVPSILGRRAASPVDDAAQPAPASQAATVPVSRPAPAPAARPPAAPQPKRPAKM